MRPPAANCGTIPGWCSSRGQPGGGGGETFTGDIQLYDVSGRLVAAAQGLHLKRADRATLLRAVGQRPSDWIYNVAWEPQPRTASVRAADAPGSEAPSWLIFADEGGIATQLAAMLNARGDRCTLVVPGAELAWQDDGWQIDPLDPAQFQALLTRPGMPPVSKIIFLWGYGSAAPAAAEQAAAGLLHLVQALVRQGAASPAAAAQPVLWVGTCEAQPVLGPPSEVGIRQAPLWGFGRVDCT